jgi:hypothetical protein
MFSGLRDTIYTFNKESLILPNGETIMHEWERPIMKKIADWVCTNGGDIIEFGFGMGISASYIQEHNINSHTICEINSGVIVNLKKWSRDKPNVIVLEGDWFDNVDKMKTYDGILFDTFMPGSDPNWSYFATTLIYKLSKQDTKFGTWHWGKADKCPSEFKNSEVETIKVNPPQNDYYNYDYFNIHKMTINKDDKLY